MLSVSWAGRARPGFVLASRSRSHGLLFSTKTPVHRQAGNAPVRRPNVKKTYEIFRQLATTRVEHYLKTKGSWEMKKDQYSALGHDSILDFDRQAKLFKNEVDKACDLASSKDAISQTDNPLFWSLRNAFVHGDVEGLTQEIAYSFHNFMMRHRFSKTITATHQKIADFRFPYEWFPATRAMQRTIHLHVGPTNSGKTYRALKALENAKSGVYAGPLRLLAHEVYSRLNAKGKTCALLTGEEQRIPEVDQYFVSCTIEMTPLNAAMDVAVIDEIQMIGDEERGFAWTQAVLGVQAKEVHICGEERAVELIQALCSYTGDKCIVHRYKRLSPLAPMDKSLNGNYKSLQKGDAVVAFSRVGIHVLKQAIEKKTGKRCAIIYGALPPETRAQQAALFNDPNNDYDFLVASDAIGMGLNLEIRRVVFEAVDKRDRYGFKSLTVPEIKQIGGRAGRYRTAAQAVRAGTAEDSQVYTKPAGQMGYVTALEEEDLSRIQRAFRTEPPPIRTAGILVPPAVLERFSTYFPPNTPLSYMLLRLRDIAKLSPRFHMCNIEEMIKVADAIQQYPMSIYDRCVILNAPTFFREHNGLEILQSFAKCVSNMDGGNLLDNPLLEFELLDIMKDEYALGASEYLRRLETLHKAITLYLWLSYRYSGVFRSQKLAFHVKSLVEERIDQSLDELSESDSRHRARTAGIRRKARMAEINREKILSGESVTTGTAQGGTSV
jgi:ATP-dependent RNA helicase SUPV3L1/SUV3